MAAAKEKAESRSYLLRVENRIVEVYVEFDKNSVGTHDEVVCKIRIHSFVNFPYPAESISLKFSEPAFNKVIERNIELKEGAVKDYEANLHIRAGIPSTVTFKALTLAFNEYTSQ